MGVGRNHLGVIDIPRGRRSSIDASVLSHVVVTESITLDPRTGAMQT